MKSMVSLVMALILTGLVAQAADKASAMKAGEAVYKKYCKTCHMDNGQGLPNVYPPVAKSDWIKAKGKAGVIDAVVNGLKGEITVNGKKFNNVMVPLPGEYSNLDAANVITYVMNSWGNSGPVVTEAEVAKVRKVQPKAKGAAAKAPAKK